MMGDILIVDGYNIIYAWPELDEIKEASLEHARSRLIDMLVDYSAFTGDRVVVVFDAHRVKGAVERSEEVLGVQVIYTHENETADAAIEKLVGEFAGQGTVYVATSDWDEQRIIFGRGAYRVTPRELRARVLQVRTEGQKPYRENPPGEEYLENRLGKNMRRIFEEWRKKPY